MSSFASFMPLSPGFGMACTSPSQQYKNNNNGSKGDSNKNNGSSDEQQQKQEKLHEENRRLKESLTRVQNEYEELRDESNYQRAKVSELSEIVATNKKEQQPRNGVSSNYVNNYRTISSNSCSDSVGESTIHNRLIDKSLENAELNLTIDRLRIKVRNTETKLQDLQIQKRENGKLLLEMSDVVRTLNSVNIEYDPTSASAANKQGDNGDNITNKGNAQLTSIKRIKLKVEAIMEDRAVLVRRCKELEEEVLNQQQHIKALEAQFHIANSANISKGVAMADAESHCCSTTAAPSSSSNNGSSASAAPHSPCASAYSAVSNLTPVMTQEFDEDNNINAGQQQKQQNHPLAEQQRSPTVEYVRQSKELDRYKKLDEEHTKTLNEMTKEKEVQSKAILKLRNENDRISKNLISLTEELTESNGKRNDALDMRDEYRDNLSDIVTHYKELNSVHTATQKALESLQSYVEKLEIELEETKNREEQLMLQRKQQQQEEEEKQERERKEQEEEQEKIEQQRKKEEEEEEAKKAADAEQQQEAAGEEKERSNDIDSSSSPSSSEERVAPPALSAMTTTRKPKDGIQSVTLMESENDLTSCQMEDLVVAYERAMKKIDCLEQNLEWAEKAALTAHGLQNSGNRNYRDAINRLRKMEKERNEYQRKLDKALEETRVAKIEARKEREEAKHVRRRLTSLLQSREDVDKYSYSKSSSSAATMRMSRSKSTSPTRSGRIVHFSSLSSSSSRSSSPSPMKIRMGGGGAMNNTTKKSTTAAIHNNLNKESYRPLTLQELMKKDFD